MNPDLTFLTGGGVMGAKMRAHDWSAHPLGPPEGWPPALRTMVSMVLNTSLLGTLLWGPEMRLIYNDAYAPALGHREPMSLGEPLRVVWSDIWDRLAPTFVPVMETGVPVFAKRFFLPMERDGAMVTTYWDYSVSPIRDEDGVIVGLLNHALDVTQEVINEEALLASQRRLHEANNELKAEVESRTNERDRMWALGQELMLIALPDGTIRNVNPLWTTLLGVERKDLIGRSLASVIHPDDLADAAQLRERITSAPVSVPAEFRLRHRDGSYRTIAWVGAFEDGHIYATGRDITVERQQLESLRQAQKMEAVGQLTGGLAHDFNNLLGGISGTLEMVGLRLEQGRVAEVEPFLAAGMGAVRRAAALTHRLLAFSRQQSLAPTSTDVDVLTDGMLDLIGRTVGPGIRVEHVRSPEPWTVLVDQPQLENSLLNLCINARDAMPDGGRILIEIACAVLAGADARRHGVPDGDYVCLSVADTGAGMPPDVVARAFDPFFTTKPLGRGTGLGLSMIYGFAQQSGGQVRIDSTQGVGTRVSIVLPRHHAPAVVASATPKAVVMPALGKGRTVLVVEDEVTVRLLVTSLLEDAGFTVMEAADSAHGLRILQSDASIDLLVSDVGLPGGMSGRQMADAARLTRPDLKVIFITGYEETALMTNDPLPWGVAVLTKPFAIDVFREAVRDMLGHADTSLAHA
ncbi:ATP-binding protein [Luteibacter sp. PPL201]|uniref:histidine kinase n=1 Tax=Luteibacter sahnii TaxID=3021977 RepID=A0ABT6B5Y6_9GAMM